MITYVNNSPNLSSLHEFALDSIHDLGAELLVPWDRDRMEVSYSLDEYQPRFSVQVVLSDQVTYLYNHSMLVGCFAHDLQRWFCRMWPGDSVSDVEERVRWARASHPV